MQQFDIRVRLHEILAVEISAEGSEEITTDDFHLTPEEEVNIREYIKTMLERIHFAVGEDEASERQFSFTVPHIRSHV